MAQAKSLIEEKIQNAKVAWMVLYPVDCFVTAYFGFLIFGVAGTFIAGQNSLRNGDDMAAIGSFVLAVVFIIASVLFGIGTTHTEKSFHMDEKAWNDYVVIILIVLTGIIASAFRYIDTQKVLVTNAHEYLSKENAEYQVYMGMLENKYRGDDDKAIAAMDRMKKEYISSQTSAGDRWRLFYEIPFSMILAVLINFCFGAMVTRYYRLRKEAESKSPPRNQPNGNGNGRQPELIHAEKQPGNFR